MSRAKGRFIQVDKNNPFYKRALFIRQGCRLVHTIISVDLIPIPCDLHSRAPLFASYTDVLVILLQNLKFRVINDF